MLVFRDFVGLSFIYAKKQKKLNYDITIKHKRAAGECIFKLVSLRRFYRKKSKKFDEITASLILSVCNRTFSIRSFLTFGLYLVLSVIIYELFGLRQYWYTLPDYLKINVIKNVFHDYNDKRFVISSCQQICKSPSRTFILKSDV